jgi:hypothetical protein
MYNFVIIRKEVVIMRKYNIRSFVLVSCVIGMLTATFGLADDAKIIQNTVIKHRLENSHLINTIIVNSPPDPPPNATITPVVMPLSTSKNGVVVLKVPAFNWSFGCSTTAAAMIAGYYDRHGYSNMYTGSTNNKCMPMNNSRWPDVILNGEVRHQCPLSATRKGLNGRTSRGHVDDYWIKYSAVGPDPYVKNSWLEHLAENCTADFMKTNIWKNPINNSDGATSFSCWAEANNRPMTSEEMENNGIDEYDGGYGLKLFYESRGYKVTSMYTQPIQGYDGMNGGFTFEQYKAEIDAERPVLITLIGHSVVGIGYDDVSRTIYLNDTWDYSTHTMLWGGSYAGMKHIWVTIVTLEGRATSEVSKECYNVFLPHNMLLLQEKKNGPPIL